MTTMAMTDAPLRRLFLRIDSMAGPRDATLAELRQAWLAKKGDRLAARLAEMAELMRGPDRMRGLIYVREPGRPDYRLLLCDPSTARFLGEPQAGELLSRAPDRRNAARSRRVFDKVVETGEPLLVEFVTRPDSRMGHAACEMLVLPLLGDGGAVEAVVTATACRTIAGQAAAPRPMRWAGRRPLLFAFARDRDFGEAVARSLDLALSPLEERDFEDGEHKARPLVDVANEETFVIASLHGDERQSVNDRLCRLLFFVGALKTNGAARVTVVAPYLCYLRKDRQTKPYDPLTSRYVAQLLEAVGADRVITMEAHNLAALQNGFRCPVLHLEAYDLFARHIAGQLGSEAVTVVAPDMGAGKRAEEFRATLERYLGRPVEKAFMEKQRSMDKVTGDLFAGDVAGRAAIIYDDMISSGTTMVRAAEACRTRGATHIHLVATHALFNAAAAETLSKQFIDQIYVANTIASEARIAKLQVIDVSAAFAGAIHRWSVDAPARSG